MGSLEFPASNGNLKRFHALIELLTPDLEARWLETLQIGESSAAATNETKSKNKKKTKKNKKKKNDQFRRPAANRVAVVNADELPIPASLPEAMLGRIKELIGDDDAEPTWMMQKKLEESDVKAQQSRLFFPNNSKLNDFLTEEERSSVVVDNSTGKKGVIKVQVVDWTGRCWMMDFKLWASLDKYVFTGPYWSKFVEEYTVKSGQILQIWSFRDSESKLCFAINVVVLPDGANATR